MTRARAVADEVKAVDTRTDARSGAAARRPGLDVSVSIRRVAWEREGALVHVRVSGGSGPFRVYVYADGELVEAWIPGGESNEFLCRALATGRHTVTARAIDAHGRWGGASVLYGGVAAPPIMHDAPRSAASSRDRGLRCTVASVERA
ncbi:MAG: hypothetical protein HYR51_10425 [Candidatus Rokubacteria bacterium]|nr:hypothetical protein [Candidatus Rokubacteria bacterium]